MAEYVYATNGNGLQVLNPADGTEVWVTGTAVLSGWGASRLTGYGGTTYVTGDGGQLEAWDITGTLAWTHAGGTYGGYGIGKAPNGDVLYISDYDVVNRVPVTGSPASVELDPTHDIGGLTTNALGDILLADSNTSNVHSYRSGTQRWQTSFALTPFGISATSDGGVALCSGTEVVKLDVDGVELWRYDAATTGATDLYGLSVGPGDVVAAVANDKLIQLTAAGVQDWTMVPTGLSANSGTPGHDSAGNVYVPVGNNVVAVSPAGAELWNHTPSVDGGSSGYKVASAGYFAGLDMQGVISGAVEGASAGAAVTATVRAYRVDTGALAAEVALDGVQTAYSLAVDIGPQYTVVCLPPDNKSWAPQVESGVTPALV